MTSRHNTVGEHEIIISCKEGTDFQWISDFVFRLIQKIDDEDLENISDVNIDYHCISIEKRDNNANN